VVSLVVLLLLGCVINLYIAFDGPGVDSYRLPTVETLAPYSKKAADQYWWPSVPEAVTHYGEPNDWVHDGNIFKRFYAFDLGFHDPYKELNYSLNEHHFGWPLVSRVTKKVSSLNLSDLQAGRTIWPAPPAGVRWGSPAVSYKPLGLILNPIIYALPVWLVLMGLRWVCVSLRLEKRDRLGRCIKCAYTLQGLRDCPECGLAFEDRRVRRPTLVAGKLMIALLVLAAALNLAIASMGLNLSISGRRPDVFELVPEDRERTWPMLPGPARSFGEPGLGSRWDHRIASHFEIAYGESVVTTELFEVYHEARYGGWPAFALRSDRVIGTGPDRIRHWPKAERKSYRVLLLGFIFNTAVYALPLWLVFIGVRWVYVTRHARVCPSSGLED
jgi:hypothetical protein